MLKLIPRRHPAEYNGNTATILCDNFFQENVEFFEKGDYFLKEGETGGVIKLAKKKISHSRRLGTSGCTGSRERERVTFERHTREEY